jgi:hypothetical protein
VVDLELDRRDHAAHAKQRAEPGMNDRAVPSQLAEPGLEADGDVQQIAVADRMLHLARVAERTEVSGKLDDRLAQREVDAEALDRGFARRDDLELPPSHPLAHGDRVLVGHGAAAVHIARLDLADADDVRAELDRFGFQVTCGLAGIGEGYSSGRHLAAEPGVLVRVDPFQVVVDFIDADRPAADPGVPVVPGKRWRRIQLPTPKSQLPPPTPNSQRPM